MAMAWGTQSILSILDFVSWVFVHFGDVQTSYHASLFTLATYRHVKELHLNTLTNQLNPCPITVSNQYWINFFPGAIQMDQVCCFTSEQLFSSYTFVVIIITRHIRSQMMCLKILYGSNQVLLPNRPGQKEAMSANDILLECAESTPLHLGG